MVKEGKQSPLKERMREMEHFPPCGYSTFMTRDRNKTMLSSTISLWHPVQQHFAGQAEAALASKDGSK